MTHRGSCHCGNVAFEVEGMIDAAIACNCSICARKGAVLAALPRERFRLLGEDSVAAAYTFHRHAIRHRFCPTCGIAPYSEAVDGDDVYLNLRCLEDFDLDGIPVHAFDGRSM